MKYTVSTTPFKVKDCAIITRMGGVASAINLRELRERIAVCPVECLYHHFCEILIRPSFVDPEFQNDFAIWAARYLRDQTLAERLGILNPYSYENFEKLREDILDIIDDHLSEVAHIPTVLMGDEFRFMQAATVIFDTGIVLSTAEDLMKNISHMSLSTLYYHFLEARRRTPMGTDDFTAWLSEQGQNEKIIDIFANVDFYFLNLKELKDTLIKALTII